LHVAIDRLVLLVFDQGGNLLGPPLPILSRPFELLGNDSGLDEIVYLQLIWLFVLLVLELPDQLLRLLKPFMLVQQGVLQFVEVAPLHIGLRSEVEQYSRLITHAPLMHRE
jgi:hypothetical protein